jgi:F-type H+-transporting ATPase subunit a
MRLTAASADGYTPPGVEDFWQPLFGTHGEWAVTRSAVVVLGTAVIIAAVLLLATRKLAVVPGKGQYLTEALYGIVRNSVARDIIGSKDFLRFVPLLFTMFTLIMVNNFLGVTPPFLFPSMSRIGLPIALTLVVFVLYHYLGIRKHGLGGYFKTLVPPGMPFKYAMVPYVFVLEFITYFFTRPVTLALRLFGNMFAGHLLMLLLITGGQYMLLKTDSFGLKLAGGFSYIMAFVMTIFEILVEFLQAYIFTLLSALYIAGALADEH